MSSFMSIDAVTASSVPRIGFRSSPAKGEWRKSGTATHTYDVGGTEFVIPVSTQYTLSAFRQTIQIEADTYELSAESLAPWPFKEGVSLKMEQLNSLLQDLSAQEEWEFEKAADPVVCSE